MSTPTPPAPRVAKVCLCCDAVFPGTLRQTRCPACVAAKVRVPAQKQAAHVGDKPQATVGPIDKVCSSCDIKYVTNKPSSKRCPDCIADNRKQSQATHRKCLECKLPFKPIKPSQAFCSSCYDPEEEDAPSLTPEQEALLRRAKELSEHQERLLHMLAYLDDREKAPKGHPKMKKTDTSRPLSVLWLEVCAADGAAASLMYATQAHGLTEDDKVTLLTSFLRFRAKGYHPAAISKLCPKIILKQATQDATIDLPKVTGDPDAVTDLAEWGRIAQAASLGL